MFRRFQGPGMGRRGPPFGGGGGGGRGRNLGNKAGAGPGGLCVCIGCGAKTPHGFNEPCVGKRCPSCGALMMRD